MSNFSITIDTGVVAWYGAIVATGGLFLSAFNFFRDRARIKLEYKFNGRLYDKNLKEYNNLKYLIISVINKGRRPVLIEKVSLRILGRGWSFLGGKLNNPMPRSITEENPKATFFVRMNY